MNINVDFRIFVNASHKIKTKFFFENRGDAFVENAIICTKIQRKILMFGEPGALESHFWE